MVAVDFEDFANASFGDVSLTMVRSLFAMANNKRRERSVRRRILSLGDLSSSAIIRELLVSRAVLTILIGGHDATHRNECSQQRRDDDG